MLLLEFCFLLFLVSAHYLVTCHFEQIWSALIHSSTWHFVVTRAVLTHTTKHVRKSETEHTHVKLLWRGFTHFDFHRQKLQRCVYAIAHNLNCQWMNLRFSNCCFHFDRQSRKWIATFRMFWLWWVQLTTTDWNFELWNSIGFSCRKAIYCGMLMKIRRIWKVCE